MIEKLYNYQEKKILIQKEANLIMISTTKEWGQMSLKYAQNPKEKNEKEKNEIIEKRNKILEFLKKICPKGIDLPIVLTPQHGANIDIVTEKDSGKGWFDYTTAIKTDALVFIEKPKLPIPLAALAADCAILLFSTNFLSGYGLLHISRLNYKFIIRDWLLFLKGLYFAKFYKTSNLSIPPLKVYGVVAPYGIYPFETQNSSTIINMRELIETEIKNFIEEETRIKIECDIKFSSQITTAEDPLFPSHHLQVKNNLLPVRMSVLGFAY